MNDRSPAGALQALDMDNAAAVAQSLRHDFIGLIAIFDRQLVNGSAPGSQVLSKINDAKAAAERGLMLASELVELLRIPS